MSLMVFAGFIALALLASPAVAQPTISARVGDTATLVAKGAAVDVAVIYTCSPDAASGAASVDLTQRVSGKRLARGSGASDAISCDGTEHTVILTEVADDVPFKKGDATAQGSFEVCSLSFECTLIRFSGTVQIR
jgi:hypothetical protein